MKDYKFAIIVFICAGLGAVFTAYFSNNIETGKAFSDGILFCFLLWLIFKRENNVKTKLNDGK